MHKQFKHITRRWWLVFLLVAIVSLTWGILRYGRSASLTIRRFQHIEIQGETLSVVVSETPAQIQRGLSYRQALGADGMLFVLPAAARPTFWMYEMQFPLDFLWIQDGVIVDLHSNVLPPTATGGEVLTIQPRTTVTHVLELPAGWVEAHQVERGMSVILRDDHWQNLW